MSKLVPPYYAVIFTSKLRNEADGYGETAQKMYALAKKQPGYLGFKSVREDIGITISYWKTTDDILSWKENIEHKEAQARGINEWYASYEIEICLVERRYQI